MQKIFSVVIPTFNRAKELARCLESLLKQGLENFEVIICDDGSTDETSDVVNSYRDKLTIIYSYAENWGGPAAPRNRGIQLATGEWICFLDSDDWYASNRLSFLHNEIKRGNCDFYYHRLINKSDTGKRLRLKTRQIDAINPAKSLLTGFNAILTSSTCIRRSKLVAHNLWFKEDKQIIGLEDYDMWMRIAKTQKFNFRFINKALGYYWSGGADHVTSLGRKQIDRIEKVYSDNLYDQTTEIKRSGWAAFNYTKAVLLYYSGEAINKNEIRQALFNAIRYGTFKVRMMAAIRLIMFR